MYSHLEEEVCIGVCSIEEGHSLLSESPNPGHSSVNLYYTTCCNNFRRQNENILSFMLLTCLSFKTGSNPIHNAIIMTLFVALVKIPHS